jgi:cell wall-associated NlpC family hydrolase
VASKKLAPADYLDLLGVPFAYGGRGPAEYDCYGLVMELARRKGSPIPDFPSTADQAINAAVMATQAAGPTWRELDKPAPGSIVIFKVMGRASHVGWITGDADRFIHTWEGVGGVCIERLADWQRRIVGFYDYIG